MRIIQVLPTIAYGDGVGNDVVALDRLIKRQGYQTGIYAENIDKRVNEKDKIARNINEIPELKSEDIILYHLSTGTDLNYRITDYEGRKVIVYHNITPPSFFEEYDLNSFRLCSEGIKGVKALKDVADYCLADSQYNLDELKQYGYTCPMEVLPILISFDDYKKAPSEKILKKYDNGKHKLVFTGRIVPNKKHEDIIEAFYYYKKYYDSEAQLFLVGSYGEEDAYYKRLCDYVKALGLTDVHFTGHIRFDEILAYYHMADVFLCMSEHEGFCIPLVEAMYFQKPIITYEGTGMKWTMDGSGFLLKEKKPLETAGVINKVINDKELRDKIIVSQNERLDFFDNKNVEKIFLKWLENLLTASKV